MKVTLIIFAITLIAINLILFKDEKKENSKIKESKFDAIFSERKENIRDYEVELGKVRKELSETIIELQREIYDLKDEINTLKIENKKTLKDNMEIKEGYFKEIKNNGVNIDKIIEDSKDFEDNNLEIDNSNKTKALKVEALLKENKSDEEICATLSIGRGELLLIKGLYKY